MHKIGVALVNRDVRKSSFLKRCVTIWNSLPEHVVCAQDISSFKRGLHTAIPE